MPPSNDTRLASHMVRLSDQAGHCARIPADLPMHLAPRGPCLCRDCTAMRPRVGCAWSPSYVLATSHTEDWRRLSYELGDAAASWVCEWCDWQRDPQAVLDAILTIAEAPQALPRITSVQGQGRVDQHLPRSRVWLYIEAIEAAR